ncbi:putative acetyltransferase [Flavobacteriaceae bacterium MAR_2010_188]|nr:putative acetyltransferase [Flavobacteriaceae bacterium MAR_2010_188]
MTDRQPTIRPIKANDNEKLAAVIRSVLLEMGMPKVGTAYADKSLDHMFETYQEKGKSYFVVEEDVKILGGGGVAPLDNFEGNVCELQKMYFLPEARGRGVGFKLLELCLDKARNLGYEQCYLETMPYMESARKLYQKYGFNNIDKPMGDTGHHACQIWMIKDL